MPTTVSPISGPKRLVTPTDNGNIIFLGEGSEGRVGAWSVQLEMDSDFVGGLVVVGRSSAKVASDDNAPERPFPYRAAFLNGTSASGPWAFAADPITGLPSQITASSCILIPASGFNVGFMVACTAGTATLYSIPVDGAVPQ
jgi:hypothetical protein